MIETLRARDVREYRRCRCGRLFPVIRRVGRPPRRCQWHRRRLRPSELLRAPKMAGPIEYDGAIA